MARTADEIFRASLAALPEPLRPRVQALWQAFVAAQPWTFWQGAPARACLERLARVWACSEFVARTCTQQPALLAALIASGELHSRQAAGTLAQRVEQAVREASDEAELKRRLRTLRRRELVRIAWRDLAGWAELDEVLAELSEFADACIDRALAWLHRQACERYGEPIGEESGAPVELVVLGLGKLGGRELNFSSDIDLIFAYAEGGRTGGASPISNHEFFMHVGRRLISVLSETTEDGFVFRVDMRLRPNGSSGELVLSFEAMEQYYQIHGREWERYALIKARVSGGERAAGERLLAELRPFVYRKYLDFGAIEAIREMKAMINRELVRRGMRNNIKQGPGGIREIEFIGQAFQLIRGGREPPLQERSILRTLALLRDRRHLQAQAVAELDAAYRFLRTVENRLQMVADQQTHQVPQDALGQSRLATAMGYGEWSPFLASLRQHMNRVQRHFDQVFAERKHAGGRSSADRLDLLWGGALEGAVALEVLAQAGFDTPEEALSLLRALRDGPAYTAFSGEGRSRIDRLMPLLLGAAAETAAPTMTLARLIKMVETIGRRSAYFVLLVENPTALSQLVKLSAASAWIAGWISQNPVLLDELLHPAGLYAPAPYAALEQELDRRLAGLAENDLEAQMDVLREFRHGHVLRVAAADVGPGLAAEEVGKHLCDIAEVTVKRSLEIAFQGLVRRHGRPRCGAGEATPGPGFAMIAYGKLGSLELGYGSDLDMIFLYEACPQPGETSGPRTLANEVFFSRLGQRLIHILTTRTRAGLLYEVDMRLRPSGQSGPLVTTLAAFREYQRERAWTWEHQALVRARAIAGKPELRRDFEAVRREVLCLARDPERLRTEVRGMREKMRSAQARHEGELFELKHDRGGLVDIEFMVQYWVLLWAARHPELTRHTDNLSLLGVLADTGLLAPERAQLLVAAYRHYLGTEHRLKLTERERLIVPAELGGYRQRVAALWQEVFEAPGDAA